MAGIALKYGATLDKYVGDAIIAFFGDPETRGVAEDAKACVAMAVEMQLRVAELESQWQEGPGRLARKSSSLFTECSLVLLFPVLCQGNCKHQVPLQRGSVAILAKAAPRAVVRS